MTDERLNDIAARAEKATPGPWGEGAPGNPRVYGPINNKGDRSFVAHSRQDIPELLAEVKRLRLALEAAQKDTARLDILLQFMLHDGSESDVGRENGISLHRPTEAETSGWRIYGFEGGFISKGESPRAAIDSLLAVVRAI